MTSPSPLPCLGTRSTSHNNVNIKIRPIFQHYLLNNDSITTNKMIHQTIDTLYGILSSTPPSQYCQTFFLFVASAVAAIAILPLDLKQILVDYGARASSSPSSSSPKNQNALLSFLSTLTKYTQVPHSWFAFFYLASLSCSVFWLGQYLLDGRVLAFIAQQEAQRGRNGGELIQTAAGWSMMLMQALRRTYEHVFVMKPSPKSTMWIVHWVLGVGFYVGMSVGVWVEGGDAILNNTPQQIDTETLAKLVIAIPVYFYAWANQYKSHKHLSSLKKYSLPTEGLFRWFVCAHYACECLLYLSMAVATAPNGAWLNRTLVCALVFVVVNLGVTASGTRRWYEQKFGKGAVEGRWNMIPFVF